MSSPSDRSIEQNNQPACLDISPERLNAMSPSELADAMEQAIDAMTEETYDPAVIDSYLDALDRKSPVPEYPDTQVAYTDFQKKLQPLAVVGTQANGKQHTRTSLRFRRVLRVGLVAAITVACLFGGMVVAQASGLDVFGAMARWTESVFSFGTLPNGNMSNDPSNVHNGRADIPEEYRDLQIALDERGLPLCFPKVPTEFDVQEPFLYIDPDTGCVGFNIAYMQGDDCVGFDITQNDSTPSTIYEKDDGAVEMYEYHGITHYIFSNMGNTTAAWIIGNMEYCITTNSSSVDIKELIQFVYEE